VTVSVWTASYNGEGTLNTIIYSIFSSSSSGLVVVSSAQGQQLTLLAIGSASTHLIDLYRESSIAWAQMASIKQSAFHCHGDWDIHPSSHGITP